MYQHDTIATPVGPFTLIVDVSNAVVASGFTDDVASLAAHAQLAEPAARLLVRGHGGDAADAVHAYFAGELAALRRIDVTQTSGPFITTAWKALRDAPPGTITYTQLAAASGRPAAVRAAASACARNTAALFVPCHRVVRSDGGLGGFRYGIRIKAWLQEHEREHEA